MNYFKIFILIAIVYSQCTANTIYETDINFRVDPGAKSCIFQEAKAGQMMEVYYQVLDGQHGELDISLDILDPKGAKLASDYKKSQNSIIMELEVDGDYSFCFDNTFSVMNSKLLFVYVVLEDHTESEHEPEAEVAEVDENGGENKEEEVLEWAGTDEEGQTYYLEVASIVDSLSRTLKYVLKARHLLDIYSATKSRDSYMAFEDTFVVDVWSGFQISLMFVVGMLQVYMIKKLFSRSCDDYRSMY